MQVITAADTTANVNALGSVATGRNRFNVSVAAGPLMKPPNTMKTMLNSTAVEKRSMRAATAVAKTVAATFAPTAQPRKKPPDNHILQDTLQGGDDEPVANVLGDIADGAQIIDETMKL